ncbi:MAG: hypothetical protein ACE37M_04250 [Henriciella sp.]
MSKLTVIVPPGEPAVSLAAAKDYLRIGHPGEDELIEGLVQAAEARLEQIAGLALVRQTMQLIWHQWPSEIAGRGIRLPVSPIIGLSAVTFLSAQDVETDITERFHISCGRLCLKPWSMLARLHSGDRVRLNFEAGFGAASDVPDDLQEAVLRLTLAAYRGRQAGSNAAQTNAIPPEVQSILDARRQVRL